jgi:hypothetical protein
MKAGPARVFVTCMLLVFFVLAAGCFGNSPVTETPTPSPSASTPTPGPEASLSGWGTDRDTYARNATATGWVNVTNTGSVPIDQVDFAIVIKRTALFVPVEKSFSHSARGLDIRPGETKKVQFVVTIPAEYAGISAAGDYQFVVTASLAGTAAGNYSKGITVA